MSHMSPGVVAPRSFTHVGTAGAPPPPPRSGRGWDAAPGYGSMGLEGSGLAGPYHACAFFENSEEEYRVLLPFAAACAQCGERCLHFVDPERRQDRLDRLAEAGIEVGTVPAKGRVELQGWDDIYLRDGRFDKENMLEAIRQTMQAGRPFGRTRLWANMEWALKGLPGSDDLVEYESRLNPVLEDHNDVVICVYEHGKYSASMVMDILRAHPMVLVGDVLQANPLYVPTERFLEDLQQRRAPRAGLRS
jgi:hypothetical protein